MQRFSKLFAVFIILCLSLNLFGCKEKDLSESSISMTTQTTQNTETFHTDHTASTKKQLEGYEYTVFNSKTIILPMLLDEYIEETEDGGSRYLINKMIEDYGWQKKDYDGDGQFTIPTDDPMEFSFNCAVEDGDYFYYDCGDMWIRLQILNLVENKEPLVLVPDWVVYSFILPDSPGENYYRYISYKSYPTNGAISQLYNNDKNKDGSLSDKEWGNAWNSYLNDNYRYCKERTTWVVDNKSKTWYYYQKHEA